MKVVFEFDDHAGAHLGGGNRQVKLLILVEVCGR